MTEREISRILTDAVPGEPGMAGLGDRVRGGHRRRRITQGALAAAALVALAVPVVWQVASTTRPEPPLLATPSPTPVVETSEPDSTPTTPTPSEPAGTPGGPSLPDTHRLNSEVCEDAQGTISDFPGATIPVGVTAIHLCSNDQEAAVPIYGAPEPIVMDASEVIARVNASAEVTDTGTCEAQGDDIVDYVVVLEYPDGERLVINTASVDCRPVVTDGQAAGRGDSEAFFLDVLTLLHLQRQTYDYAYVNEAGLCPEAASIIGRSIYDVVRGAACGVDAGSDDPNRGQVAHLLPDALVAEIVNEATANATPAPAHGLPLFSQTLVLRTRFGDPLTLYRWPDGNFYFREGSTWLEWMPSEGLARELETYFVGTRTEFFPEPPQPELCMDSALQDFDGPLSDAFTAEACVLVGDGVYETHSMPPEVFDGFIADLEAAATTVPREAEFEFTGHWIAVLNHEGRSRQLFVTADGTLVWDDQQDVEARYTAAPPQRVADWLGEAGIDVQ